MLIYQRNKVLHKILKLIIFVLSISIFFSGCATMFSGSTQIITINSEPSDADVLINGLKYGKTPLSTQVKKDKNTIVTIQKDGYTTITRPIQSTLDPVTILGLYPGLGFPITTDMINGNAYEYSPSFYKFDLQKNISK